MKAQFVRHKLRFIRPGGTSRGVLKEKETYFLILEEGEKKGIGECGCFRGLSHDDRPDYEEKLTWLCGQIELGHPISKKELTEFPSIAFGFAQATKSIESNDPFLIFPTDFTQGARGIDINGLIWMGEKKFMFEQIKAKIDQGFKTLKLKIGAIDFQEELDLLNYVRSQFSAKEMTLRVDANGAFDPGQALEKLKRLSAYDLHSIEQPIKAGQWDEMAKLCQQTPLPIALDEELIGVLDTREMERMLHKIRPQFIILKPSLLGDFERCDLWMEMADALDIGYWITSALESNVGLNALAQYTYARGLEMPQGLGTGGLFSNNVEGPLRVREGHLFYDPSEAWNLEVLSDNSL